MNGYSTEWKMQLNNIYKCDVMEGMRQLEDNSIDLIITSPPYNKADLNGINKAAKWNKTIDYGGNAKIDNMPEEQYEQWQIDFLAECYRVLKTNGSMFYNHKNRIWRGHGEIVSPYKWLLKTDFKIRQEIIWDRKNSPNQAPSHYVPAYEQIFWLTKTKSPAFYRKDCKFKTDVWRFSCERNNAHPAPFPIELPDNIIPCIAQGKDIIVLDPFMGSGTTAIAALKNNCHYIGFEMFQEYIDMANERIKDYDRQGN